MPLSVTATLVDGNGRPLSGVAVQVGYYDARNVFRAQIAGKSNIKGSISLRIASLPGNFLPQLGLRAQSGRSWRLLSRTPSRYTPTRASFGRLEVDLAQPPLTLGSSKLFARPLDLKVAAFEAIEAADKAKISQLSTSLSAAGKERDSFKQQLAAATQKSAQGERAREQLAAENSQLKAQIARLEAIQSGTGPAPEPDAPVVSGPLPGSKVGIDTLFNNAASKLEATDSRLRSSSGFRLGKVSLKLKVLPSEDGGSVVLPDAETIARLGANNLSELNLDLNPPPSGRGQSSAAGTVPELVGYTRALAERKLAAQGLRADYLEEQVGKAEQAGRILRQSPAAGAESTPGDIVELTIGAAPPTPGESPR